MTLILIVLGLIALFFVMQRKSWFMAFGVILLFSSVAIITSIIQIQIVTALGLLALIGIMWGTRATRRSVSRTRSRLSSLFGSTSDSDGEGAEKEQTQSEVTEDALGTEPDFIDKAKIRQQRSLLNFVLLITFIALFVPIALYAREFGIEGWQQYQSWMGMGNELTGVYSIITALLVFLFLVTMLILRFQNKAADNDQTFIQDSRKDIEFYLTELDHYLSQWADESSTVRQQLHKRCSKLSEKKLSAERTQEKLAEFAESHVKLMDIWHPLVQILEALAQPGRFPYSHNHQRCIQKVISILSQETCEALDKLAFAGPMEGSSSCYFWEQLKTN